MLIKLISTLINVFLAGVVGVTTVYYYAHNDLIRAQIAGGLTLLNLGLWILILTKLDKNGNTVD